MAKIESNEVLEGTIKKLRLSPARDKVPTELGTSVNPVFVVNESGKDEVSVFEGTIGNIGGNFTISVPAGKKWKLCGGCIAYVCTATVGNRRLKYDLMPLSTGSYPLFSFIANDVMVASASERYNLNSASADYTETYAGRHNIPFPKDMVIKEGARFIFDDIGSTDNADTIVVCLTYKEYSIDA